MPLKFFVQLIISWRVVIDNLEAICLQITLLSDLTSDTVILSVMLRVIGSRQQKLKFQIIDGSTVPAELQFIANYINDHPRTFTF